MVALLLVLVGQVTALSAIPCQMDSQMDSQLNSHMDNQQDHSAMGHMPDDSDYSATDDCCAENPNCSMNGCHSFTLPTLLTTTEVVITTQNIEFSINLAPSQSATSLYRPPILS